jgi:hypothetical protein
MVRVAIGSYGPDPRCDSQVLHHEGYDGRVTYLGIGNLFAGAGVAGFTPPEISQLL